MEVEEGGEIGSVPSALLQGVGPDSSGCDQVEQLAHDVTELCVQPVSQRWVRKCAVECRNAHVFGERLFQP